MNFFVRVSIFPALLLINCTPGTAAQNAAPPNTPPAHHQPEASPASPASNASERQAEVDPALLAQLPASKLTLAQALRQAELFGGAPISAKFELDRGQLSLSVYTAKSGLSLDAEHNVLAELSGDPRLAAWQPQEEVFADTAHIARAAYHLTLVQRSGTTLDDVLTKAAARQAGQIYSVTPAAQNGKLVFHVFFATAEGGQVALDIEGG
jgi:hypothetical protein